MPIDAATAKSVFLAALEKEDAVERAAFLDHACAGDTELRERVDALLKGHESGSFPDFVADAAPAFDVTQSVVNTPADATQTSAGPSSGTASLGFLAPPSNPANLGRLDHYEVISVLGQGGMGVVLKAFDESLDRVVAIKVLGAQYAANGTARKRFIREAKAVAAVSHEHVVHVYAVDERVPYLVMQYIQGISLQDRIDKSGPLELKEILRIGMQIADGLAAAHKQGIVHRDIKPSNILLENGIERVKLTDFGLARAVDDASVTQSGVIAGTPMYMSPEQARGEQVDPRSDLFSLGSVLYAMCTGHAPFRASGTMAVMKRVIEDSPRSICEQHPEVPDWLEAIVFKLLAKHPDDRFQSAKDLAQLLEQHLAHLQQPSAVAMPAPVERLRQRSTKRKTPPPKRSSFPGWAIALIVFVLAAPCLLILISFFGWFLMSKGSDSPNYNKDGMSIGPPDKGGAMMLNEANRPSLTVNLNSNTLRVETVGEDGTAYPSEMNGMQAIFRNLPPGNYHTSVYRPGKPEVLVAQQTFNLLTTGSSYTFRADSNWTQLFNGKDLTGWKIFPEDRKSWKVVNGMLIGKGQPSHLFTERGDYVNFHLRIETLLEKDSACGQFARVPFGDPGRFLFPHGKEELFKLDVPALYGKDAKPINPAPPTYRTSALAVWGVGKNGQTFTRKPPGEGWFVQELIADGPNVTVMLSGGPEGHSAGWTGTRTDGHIALQLFDSDSVVRYRKIEIKELPAPSRDEDRLQGSWHAVDGEFAGEKLTANELKTARITFTGERMRRAFPPKRVDGEGSFTLNPTASPKQITIKGLSDKNTATDGIYRFEGERLILCMGGVADSRPTEFSSKGAKSYSLIVFERDPADVGFVSLFNGKTLDDWVIRDEADEPTAGRPWEVLDGTLIARGSPSGYLRTRKAYRDYILEFECQSSKPFTASERVRAGEFIVHMPEPDSTWEDRAGTLVQLVLGGKGQGSVVSIVGGTFRIDDEVDIDLRGFQPGWNKLRLELADGKLTLELNGKSICERHDVGRKQGYFALVSAGAGMRYRNIRIKELPTPMTDQQRLQGNWKIVAHEEGGEPLPARLIPPPSAMSLSFAGDRAELKSSIPLKSDAKASPKFAWDGVLHLDPSANPKRMNVFIPGDNKNSMIGIYRFEGERLIVCLIANPTKLDYPTAFATKKGDGLIMLTLERFEAKQPAPFMLTPPKVLEHMVGSWSIEITQRTGPAQPFTKHVGHVVIEPVAGGRFNRTRTVTDNGGPDDMQLSGFDRETWEFRGFYFDTRGAVRSDSVGRFDAASRTISYASQPELGVIRIRTTRFPDADTIEYDVIFRDQDGKTLLDRKAVMKRQKGRIDIDEPMVADAPKELGLLQRLIGTSDSDMTSKLRKNDKWKTQMVGRKILGGRFIELTERLLPSGEENYTLIAYDNQKKAFRQWYVSSRWSQAQGLAGWDDATKTMTWDCEGDKGTGNETKTTVVWKFVSDDKTEFRIVVKDKDGKTLEDVEGTNTRRVKSK